MIRLENALTQTSQKETDQARRICTRQQGLYPEIIARFVCSISAELSTEPPVTPTTMRSDTSYPMTSHPMSLPDTRALRDALGSFATGITVVTTITPNGEAIGVTINSFNSVSLDPPLILWSLGNTSPYIPGFCAAKHYVINILSSEQTRLSQHFASRPANPLAHLSSYSINGVPMIDGCCAQLECTHYAQYPGGDHLIFVGQVTQLTHHPARQPLIYYAGNYRCLAPL